MTFCLLLNYHCLNLYDLFIYDNCKFLSDLVSYQNYWRIVRLSLNMKNYNSEAILCLLYYLLTSVDVCFNNDEPYEKR